MYFAPFWTAIWSKGHEPCFFVYTVHHWFGMVWTTILARMRKRGSMAFSFTWWCLRGMECQRASSQILGCHGLFANVCGSANRINKMADCVPLVCQHNWTHKKTNRWSTENGWKAKFLHNVSIQIFKIPCYVLLDLDLMKSINQAASEAARNAHKVQAENRMPDQI